MSDTLYDEVQRGVAAIMIRMHLSDLTEQFETDDLIRRYRAMQRQLPDSQLRVVADHVRQQCLSDIAARRPT